MTGPLWQATRDLHHACEAHPIGQAMINGAITPRQWADWLWAMRVLHMVVDISLPASMAREAALGADLASLPTARASAAVLTFAASLVGRDMGGAGYVLHGAHRSGGRVLAPKMARRGLPTAHACYLRPDNAQAWLAKARNRSDWASQARETFDCLLSVMDEIVARGDVRAEARS